LLLVLGTATFSQAADVPSSSVTFCVNKKTFAVSQRTACKSTEKTLTVNQLGQTGPTGPMGRVGPAGPSSLPEAFFGGSTTPTRASGVQVATDANTPLPVWEMPSDGRFLVTQNFVVNAFPTNRDTKIELQCFIGDLSSYFSGVSITAVPEAQLPQGAQTFNTGYGSITYVTAGVDRYVTPFCRNLSGEANVYVASFTAAAIKLGSVGALQ
jgi:hypothetical protein